MRALGNTLAVLFFAAALLPAQVNPNLVLSITFSPPAVDALNGDQNVVATVVTNFPPNFTIDPGLSTLMLDDVPSLSHLETPLLDGGPCTMAPGCKQFIALIVVPQGTSAGNYAPSLLFFLQGLGSWWIDSTTLQSWGITSTLTVTNNGSVQPSCTVPPLQPVTPSGGISDTTPPALVGLCLDPYNLDTRPNGNSVQVTLNITDDLAGFQYGYIYFYSPSGNQYQYSYFDQWSLQPGGDPLSGIYQYNQWFPASAESGPWTFQIYLYDNAGNYSYPQLPPGATQVLNITSAPDTTPPTWAGMTLSGSYNVSAGPQNVPISIHLTDDNSGVDPYGSYVVIQSPSGNQYFYIWLYQLTMTGTPLDGSYSGTFVLPRYSEPGLWKIGSANLKDLAANTLYMGQYGSVPAPAGNFTVVSNPADTLPPTLQTVSITPGAINTSAADQIVQVQFGFADALSGLDVYYQNWMACSAQLSSPSGNQRHYQYGGLLQGTVHSGVVALNITMPRYSEIGTWILDYAYCKDVANNYFAYNRATLVSRGQGVNLIVIQPSQQIDGTFTGGATTIHDAASQTTLTDPTGQVPSGTTVAIDLLAQAPVVQPPQGFSIGTGYVSVVLTPPLTAPLPPPGLTITIPLVNQLIPGTELALYKLDLASGKLVQAPKAGGGYVTGFVDAGGQSATFTGISSFSTVVGLNPPAKPGDLNSDGVVNCTDVLIIRGSWGKRNGQNGFDGRADYNRDNIVNIFDLAAVSKLLPRGTKCW